MAEFLDPIDWLEDAKHLPVGGKARIRHGFESRTNLMIFNNADSWSCWCFACNAGGKVKKDSPVLTIEKVIPNKPTMLPADAVDLMDAPVAAQEISHAYLGRRGIAHFMLGEGIALKYSESVQRVCLEMYGNCYSGRALCPNPVKAITYSVDGNTPPKFGIHPKDSPMWEGRTVVLTEDYLSALKVRHAMQDSVVAVSIQGSGIGKHLIAKLLESKVLIMLDGDAAGVKGSKDIFGKLRGLVDVAVINTPTGKDPKNLSSQELRSLLL